MPGEALLRGPWAQWQRDPAKELCCDKSDSQPYFYSSINLIGRKKSKGAREPRRLSPMQEMSELLPGAALVEHALMTIIYFLLSSWSQILICSRSVYQNEGIIREGSERGKEKQRGRERAKRDERQLPCFVNCTYHGNYRPNTGQIQQWRY